MRMIGTMLADLAPGFVLAETVDEFPIVWQRELTPIWAPTRMVLAATGIPASWDVTSDSLAAWLATHIGPSASSSRSRALCRPPPSQVTRRDWRRAGVVDVVRLAGAAAVEPGNAGHH